jgi:hypothetical protein
VAGDSAVCPCSIALEPYVVLRDSDGRAGLSYPLALEQTGAGGWPPGALGATVSSRWRTWVRTPWRSGAPMGNI